MIAKVMQMEKFVEQALLFDFYGELLTEHQRMIYEDVVCNDLSYSEVAQMQGITRQGVHDMMKRCNKILSEYEEKLHLVERFLSVKEKVQQVKRLAGQREEGEDSSLLSEIEQISDEILEEL